MPWNSHGNIPSEHAFSRAFWRDTIYRISTTWPGQQKRRNFSPHCLQLPRDGPTPTQCMFLDIRSCLQDWPKKWKVWKITWCWLPNQDQDIPGLVVYSLVLRYSACMSVLEYVGCVWVEVSIFICVWIRFPYRINKNFSVSHQYKLYRINKNQYHMKMSMHSSNELMTKILS